MPVGAAQSRAGDLAARASPRPGREHSLRAQTSQDGPCHGKLPGRRGDGRAALTLAGVRGAGDRGARSSGRSQVTAFPTLTSGFPGVAREGRDPPTFLSHTFPTGAHALHRPGLQGQRQAGVPVQPALTSCVTCSSPSLGLSSASIRNVARPHATAGTTPTSHAPNAHRPCPGNERQQRSLWPRPAAA